MKTTNIDSEMASEQDDSIITVVTCEGNISDPDFPYKLSSLVARLRRLLLSADKPFHITNVEPWNSVRVTFNIPREAAQRLRQLAHAGDRVLRDLGILSVQIEGDQVISLTIAGRFNEPQEILLQTTEDDRSRPPSASSFDLSALEASSSSSGVDPGRKSIPQFLSQQGGTGTAALATPSTASQESLFVGPLASQADFKSPNVIAPGSEPIPFPPKTTPTPPSRTTANYGPFPFASMQHAMNTMQNSHHTATTPPQGSSPNRFPFSPPPPYPGNSPGAFQPVRPLSAGSATTTTQSTATTSSTVVNNLPRGVADRANAALTSPLLVNLLQSDLSGSGGQLQHSGGKVFPPPPSEPVAAPKRKRKPRKPKEKPSADGAPSSPLTSPGSCHSSSSLGLPAASDSNSHSLFTQPFNITLPTVPSIPLSPPSLTPPSASPPSLIGQPLTPTEPVAHPFSSRHIHHPVPPLPSPPPTAPPSSASTSNNSGQSSHETEHELSPWPSPSKRTQHLINPFTGQLEPMSSDEDEEDSSDRCQDAVSESPGSSLQSNPFSEVGRSNEGARRVSTEGTPNAPMESKAVEVGPAFKDVPSTAAPPSPSASNSSAGGSPSEKIKLRLKLEPKLRVEKEKESGRLGEKQKVDGVQSMLQYKVDVSFVNIPSRRVVGSEASAAGITSAANNGGTPAITSSTGGGPGNSNAPLEPRVPPLHISLRGRNAAVVTNPRREIGEVPGLTPIGEGPATVKMPRARSPRGSRMDGGGRKAALSRGGGNSRRGRGSSNHPAVITTAMTSSTAALISAVARSAANPGMQQHPALEGRALAASPPSVAREKTLLSGGSFVLEPGSPSSSKHTAQVPNVLPGRSPSAISPPAMVSSVQIPRIEAEASLEEEVERKSHQKQEHQSGPAELARDNLSVSEKVPDGPTLESTITHREINHSQLTMQQMFSEERLKLTNPTPARVNVATSELNALLDRPVSPYNPNITRRNSAEGAKNENLVRPTLAKGMHDALAAAIGTHSMRSSIAKFQNVHSTHQRNVLDERLQHNTDVTYPPEAVQRERLREALRLEPRAQLPPTRRPSRERPMPATGVEAGVNIAENQQARNSSSSLAEPQRIAEEQASGFSKFNPHANHKEAVSVRPSTSPRLTELAEPVVRPTAVTSVSATDQTTFLERTEMTSSLADTSTKECEPLWNSDKSQVCSVVTEQFAKSHSSPVTVLQNCADGEVAPSEHQRLPLPNSPVIPECVPAASPTEDKAHPSADVHIHPEGGADHKSRERAEKAGADIFAKEEVPTVVADDRVAVRNRILDGRRAGDEVKKSPEETKVPLVDVDLPPQIPGIARSSKVSTLGSQEKIRLAATIGPTRLTQLVPSRDGGVLVEGILHDGRLDGLPEEEGEGDAEFVSGESMPHHHHLLNSVARSASMAIVTITASPSSASPSGSSPDSLNIGGTSSEENGDNVGGRGHGDHRGRHHPFLRNQCGSGGSPYEDSGIDSMDAIMEKQPDELSPGDKAEDAAGAVNDPPLPQPPHLPSPTRVEAQQANSAASGESKEPSNGITDADTRMGEEESTGNVNQNYERDNKESTHEPGPTLDTHAENLKAASPSTSSTEMVETSTDSSKAVGETGDESEQSPKDGVVEENPDREPSDGGTSPVPASVEDAAKASDEATETESPIEAQRPLESQQVSHETVSDLCSEDAGPKDTCTVPEQQQPISYPDADSVAPPGDACAETDDGIPRAESQQQYGQVDDSKPLQLQDIPVSLHSIVGVTQEECHEETANILVFQGENDKSGHQVTVVAEEDATEPESPTGTTQVLVFAVEDVDSIMVTETATHEMSLLQVTPANKDGSATLEFSALTHEDACMDGASLTAAFQDQTNVFASDTPDGDSQLMENCMESAKSIAVVQVQLADVEPGVQTGESSHNDLEHPDSKAEEDSPEAIIATATVMLHTMNSESNCSREANVTSEPSMLSSKSLVGQVAIPGNISLLAGTPNSSLQGICPGSTMMTVSSEGGNSAVSTTFVQRQQGEVAYCGISSPVASMALPLKLVTLPTGVKSLVSGHAENGGVSLAHPISSTALLPNSPVKPIISPVCHNSSMVNTAPAVALTTVLVKSPVNTSVAGPPSNATTVTSTASIGVYPVVSSATESQMATSAPVNSSFPNSQVAPPLVRPTAHENDVGATPNSGGIFQTGSSSQAAQAVSLPTELLPSRRPSPNSPPRSRTWLVPTAVDGASAIQNPASSTAIIVTTEHVPPASTLPSNANRTATPSPVPASLNLSHAGNLTTHFLPLPTVVNEGKQDSIDSDADTNCSTSSMSSESGHHHLSDTGQEDGNCSKDEADDMYMGNTSITSGDHNYIFRASRNSSADKGRDRRRARKTAKEKQPEAVTNSVNCDCNSSTGSPDRSSVSDGSKLEHLSIEIPSENDVCEVERRATRSTRSNSRLASPNSGRQSVASVQLSPNVNSCIVSPPSAFTGTATSDAETEVRTLPVRNAAKRKREDSDSDSERLKGIQNSQNVHGGAAAQAEKEETVLLAKSLEKDLACPKSPVYANANANAHVYSKPVKRKCSENAVELIKACIGVDDNPKRIAGGKIHPNVDGARPAITKNMKLKEDGTKTKGRINASLGEGSEESSDDEVTLSELATKARSGKAKQGINNVTEDRSITRNAKQRQSAKEEEIQGTGKIERVNSRSSSRREESKAGRGAGVQRESRKEERGSSRLGGRHSERGRRASPQTRGQERSPQRTNHRSKVKEHDRPASPNNPREDSEAGKRKLRSSGGTSGYYDSLPQKRRRFSRDNR